MATREQPAHQPQRPQEPDPAELAVDSAAPPVRRQLLEDVDELLDEIDGVLEANAEEFIRSYVQKGGE
jgi:prokaryotic ubiquitin-like protein Pup